jgi:hypothetical protein
MFEMLPSPKPQLQVVGELVDISVNCTVKGPQPEVGVAEKSVTGVCAQAVEPPRPIKQQAKINSFRINELSN